MSLLLVGYSKLETRAAGSDTTATGLRATLLCIITNPPVYQKLVGEIDAAVALGKIPSAANEIISNEQARQLPYLQACVKEVGIIGIDSSPND